MLPTNRLTCGNPGHCPEKNIMNFEHPDRALIERFYKAFQRLDVSAMCACYDPKIVFHDPVFGLLREGEVEAMWKMLCSRADGFSLRYETPVDLGEGYHTCDWEATYFFSAKKRRVVNKVRANMRITNGLISEHSDAFSMPVWCRQAFGMQGYLLGWSGYFQRQVKLKAGRQLLHFIQEGN